MIKKFKCVACGKKFDADDKDSIVCPKCHSDNVTPVKPNYIIPIGIFLLLIISIGAGMFVTKQLKGEGNLTPSPKDSIVLTDAIDTKSYYDIDPELMKEIIIENTKPAYDKTTKSYNFSVSVKNVPEGSKITYELCGEYDPQNKIKKVLMTSTDGVFESVPASKNELGTYFVVVSVIGKDGQVITSKDREIDGFEDVKPVTTRLAKAQLQSMINRRDRALQGGNHNISNNVVILVRGDSYKPETFQDVFNNLEFGIWQSVSVISVDYDSDNRVNKVVLSVVPADNN